MCALYIIIPKFPSRAEVGMEIGTGYEASQVYNHVGM